MKHRSQRAAPVEQIDAEHDDELADFGGAADVAVIAVTVAMHVAALALLYRSAATGASAKQAAARSAAIVCARLRRRGSIALADLLEPCFARPGFDTALAAAATTAADRIAATPRRQLERAVGRTAATELLALGAKACTSGGRLGAASLEALAIHLEQGAEVSVGLGRGSVLLRAGAPAHRVVEVELARIPDPQRRERLQVRQARRRGGAARELQVPATLVLITNAGRQEIRVSRDGRARGPSLVIDSASARLTATLRGSELVLEPSDPDPVLVDRARSVEDWATAHRAVQGDALLAELVSDLYTRPGFGGSAEILRALLDLAPLIHEHESIARRFVGGLPATIQDPVAEIVLPLERSLLHARAE